MNQDKYAFSFQPNVSLRRH